MSAPMTATPFDDIRALISSFDPPRSDLAEALEAGLGRFSDTAAWIAAWTGRARPAVNRPVVALYAAAYAPSETAAVRARLEACSAGGAVINRIAQGNGAGLEAFDLAIDRPGGDGVTKPAMSEKECAATMAFGMEALAKQPDLLILGALSGQAGAAAAGRLLAALEEGAPPLEALRDKGGRDMAAIAGAILAARSQQTPVLLDGACALAAAAALHDLHPGIIAHCRLAELPKGEAAARTAERLRLTPLLTIGLDDGEAGAAGVAAVDFIRAACLSVVR
ncbi:nicotinate-nucleotide--dimethylbenzimidazole phosphoribosyltransferase [Caulobacter segnis]|uniref:nicotinate-nucleotide--dimethylbenzimidazole phosphoribosyltransferase n=1 Tax=Caulobacter segnis TaxID=88688 RepID=UPI00240FE329|nr:nicotinate-nucleotide--dimethylbenzimidazole phosphoribosyltransferase [Caulobacter segnis]MDG2522996.1 nicotinate-nucleotide--dimethylbenzimidazole phosphoribosyltransferase [Caulobacter segnis]